MMHARRLLLAALLATAGPLAAQAEVVANESEAASVVAAGGDARAEGLARILQAAFPDGAGAPAAAASPTAGRDLFLAVLGSEAFLHEAVGPFDVHVEKADGLKKAADAKKTLQRAVQGLQPLVALTARHFGRQSGAIAGRRFPVVLCSARRDKGETAFDDLLALLDDCEDKGFSGWKPDLPLWTDDNRAASLVRTWEVAVFNLAHAEIAAQDKAWFEHGLGYEVVNQLCNRLFAKGAWGPPPPWLRQGLVDELDIEAYGTAWVAAGESSSFATATAGWRREGWEGFVPEGQQPPPPVTGPPPDLSKSFTTKVNADTWLARSDSSSRHWSALEADRKSEAPASLCAMAAAQSYGPRDRAYARCVLHLLLEVAPPGDLLAALDRESVITETGMRDADPLPVLVARALGGLPELDQLEAHPLQDVLTAVGRQDVLKRIGELGAADLLAIADHREQARWLWSQSQFDQRSRQALFLFIVQAEGYQELGEWEVVGQALDRAAAAALAASASYPKSEAKRRDVAEAFQAALAAPSAPVAPAAPAEPAAAGPPGG